MIKENGRTIVEFPRGIKVDIHNIPDDFEEQIKNLLQTAVNTTMTLC